MILIETEQIGTVEGLHAIRQEWDRLLEACPDSTPFQSYDWLVAWWKRFGQGRPLEKAEGAPGMQLHVHRSDPRYAEAQQGGRQCSSTRSATRDRAHAELEGLDTWQSMLNNPT